MPYPELNPGYGILPVEHQRSICQINCWFTGQTNPRIGSGFLQKIGDNSIWVATAGHQLYNHGLKSYPSMIEVFFGRSGYTAFRHFTLEDMVEERCFVPEEFVNGDDGSSEFDFALLKISTKTRDIIAIPCSWGDPVQAKVKLLGYPCEHSAGEDPYHAILEVDESGPNNFDYVHQTTYEGMSGGPLLARTGSDKTIKAFGMHIRGHSVTRAIRFSGAVQMRMRGWTT